MSAPLPWRIEHPNSKYFVIADASGNRICDFYPFAALGGRGMEATLAIAQGIVDRANTEEGESQLAS